MAETPTLYMPDFPVQWNPQQMRAHRTEVNEARSGREQRRGVYASAGRRRYVARSNWFLNPDDRRSLYDFFNLMRGRLTPFYFWEPARRTINFTLPVGGVANSSVFWTIGTNGAGDTWHAMAPWKGDYRIGDSPLSAVYPTAQGIKIIGLGSPASIAQLASSNTMSIPPRGNNYCTFRFNGFNQYGDAGAAANTRIAGDQTWAAWVFLRPADTPASGALWVIASNESLNNNGVLFALNSSRQPIFRTNQAGTNTLANCATAIPLNSWHHVAVTRSGTSVTFYIDGVAIQTITGINNPVTTATVDFQIGASAGGSFFHGAMNDVRVYAAALQAGDCKDIVNGNLSWNLVNAGSMAGLWKLTEGKGAVTFADSGQFGYGATIVNPSDDCWVGGEDEFGFGAAEPATFLSLPQIQNARERIQARFDMDEIPETFLQSGGVYPAFDISIREVI